MTTDFHGIYKYLKDLSCATGLVCPRVETSVIDTDLEIRVAGYVGRPGTPDCIVLTTAKRISDYEMRMSIPGFDMCAKTMELIAYDLAKRVRPVTCTECAGVGTTPSSFVRCRECFGAGVTGVLITEGEQKLVLA